jgi:glycosyltransferase involved in cell wall biosynthesis
VVFAPVTTRATDYRGCRIEAANVRIVELPDFATHLQAARRLPAIWRAFQREVDSIDVINCRNTAPFGYLLYCLARRRGIGFFYHFTSDPWEILTVSERYRGALGLFARAAYALDFQIQKRVMRRTFSFVNGRLPYERARGVTDRVALVISSTLAPSDLTRRSSAVLHNPVRLLYVGYLKHMKGLTYLIDALRILRSQGADAELHLLGAGPEEHALRRAARGAGLSERVTFHGYVPMGAELNRRYDEADIFVFPSLSEGSPRVVLEALAHGLPVVSTSVGSVPDLIRDGQSGLIVPLRDAGALARAIRRFIDDAALRARCAAAAYDIAAAHTVERFIAPLVAKARELTRR